MQADYHAKNLLISDNTITDCGDYAIYVDMYDEVNVKGNHFNRVHIKGDDNKEIMMFHNCKFLQVE